MKQKISYAMGGLGDTFMNDILEGYLSYFYITTLGVNPIYVGIAMMVPRLWDMITDPFMGNFSDNFRSKWGRRKPFILVGGILCSLPFTLVWMASPDWNEWMQVTWLLVSMLVYSTVYTVYFIPYNSLGAELSTDYNERTNVSTVRMFVVRVAGLSMAPLFEIVYNKEVFSNEQIGYTVVALVFSILSVVGYYWLFRGTKEKTFVQSQEKINLAESFRYTFRNKPFLLLLIVTIVGGLAYWSVMRMGRFVNVYYVHGGDEESVGRINTIAEVVSIFVSFVSIALINYLSKRFGKLVTRIFASAFTMLLQILSWFLFDPEHPYLYIVFTGATGLTYASYILSLSMTADVADEDELSTGRRREGMFFGVTGLVQKISFSVGPLLTGLILNGIGFMEDLDVQSESTIWWMRFIFAFCGIPLLGLAILVLCFYPLTEKRVREIRAELDRRNESATTE